jgi:hypothetical protein
MALYKESLTKVGYWNYDSVYKFLFEWFIDEGYTLKENSYKEKLTPAGKEILISWTAEKKLTSYFKRTIDMDWHILTMKDAEIEVNGKKIKTNKGEIKIVFKSDLVIDYKNQWKKENSFHKMLSKLYQKYILRPTIEEYAGGTEDETKKIIGILRNYLEMI